MYSYSCEEIKCLQKTQNRQITSTLYLSFNSSDLKMENRKKVKTFVDYRIDGLYLRDPLTESSDGSMV